MKMKGGSWRFLVPLTVVVASLSMFLGVVNAQRKQLSILIVSSIL